MSDNPFITNTYSEPSGIGKYLLRILFFLSIVTSLFLVLYLFVFNPNQVDGPSMLPNFVNDEFVLTSKLSHWLDNKDLGIGYERGDVIVFQTPKENKAIIKRIIGLPGDHIAIRNNAIYLNGKRLNESDYLPPSIIIKGGDFIVDGAEGKIVPPGTYFAVGDNRTVSRDSRYASIGFIEKKYIKGEVIMKIYPNIQMVHQGKLVLIEE